MAKEPLEILKTHFLLENAKEMVVEHISCMSHYLLLLLDPKICSSDNFCESFENPC